MADKYYDYSKLKTVVPYQPGKSKPDKFTKDTRPQRANEGAAQRKSDLAQVRDNSAQAQKLSAIKQSLTQGSAQTLTSGAGSLDSVLSNAIGSKVSKKA